MMAAILNSAIMDSAILHKKNFTHSFWLNLMMAAILKSAMLDSDTAILDSDILLSFLRFTQKYSHSTLTLTQTNSIWLKLIQFSLNLMMAAILNSAIFGFSHFAQTSLLHSDSTWWWQPSWILPSWNLPSWIQPSYYFLSNSLTLAKIGSNYLHKKTSNWFILTQLDDGSHLEFCTKLWLKLVAILFILTQLDDGSHLELKPSWIQPFCTKKTSLIHSDSTWWWQPSWSLPCWIQTLPSWIQTSCYLFSDSLKNTLTPFWLWLKLIQSDSNSLILT